MLQPLAHRLSNVVGFRSGKVVGPLPEMNCKLPLRPICEAMVFPHKANLTEILSIPGIAPFNKENLFEGVRHAHVEAVFRSS